MENREQYQGIKLEWFGHSCFRLEVNGTILYFDPVGKNELLKTTLDPSLEAKPRAIFISHEHWDHCNTETIQALDSRHTDIYCPESAVLPISHGMSFEAVNMDDYRKMTSRIHVVEKGDVGELEGIKVQCLEASEGLAYLVTHGNKTILFMGDSVATQEMMDAEPDIVLFPIWAVQGEEAQPDMFNELAQGRLCIPMHYHTSPRALPNFFIASEELGLLEKRFNLRILKRNEVFYL